MGQPAQRRGGPRRGESTIVAIATPPGRGALGVVRLSGGRSQAIVQGLTKRKDALKPRHATLAKFYDGGDPLDEGIAVFYPAGQSYTGEESVEISVHGSSYVLERLVALCLANGAHSAGPGEFTQRAFLNGRLDLSQAEAVCDLIASRTKLSASAALDRLEGGLSRRVASLRTEILELTALVEANLDHPDEDIPPLPEATGLQRLADLSARVQALAAAGSRARLDASARVAIVGPANAGKSSLLNALLGRDRAIISETAGTTRDTLDAPMDLGGLDASLIDTAGLRDHAQDPIEREGHTRALNALRGADLGLVVLDRTVDAAAHRRLLDALRGETPLIIALNKSDLDPSRTAPTDLAGSEPVIEVSALSGTGVDDLESLLRRSLKAPDGESGRAAITARHAAAFAACAVELEEARRILPSDSGERTALHLRDALNALDPIDGRTTTDDLLGTIFSRFCVGK